MEFFVFAPLRKVAGVLKPVKLLFRLYGIIVDVYKRQKSLSPNRNNTVISLSLLITSVVLLFFD